ncbi:DNA-methyltransferase [Kitasatospora mediocidica]|uniref:DNA-methyltransferase n=1 Tax=Kitasatospora mediocidica TaxID=58352 RepID=UPI00068C6C1C|nr:site-specific DNA-methyltransferase [Kitasatospora mediocidica]
MEPYYQDETVRLYLGDCREVLPGLGLQADLLVVDPPYGDTALAWDRWPDGWPTLAATTASSMWCFGSMRMFLTHGPEFTAAGWRMSQDIVWEKHNGSSRAADRFRRIHEHALHWYRGKWGDVHHETPRTATGVDRRSRVAASRDSRAEHLGTYSERTTWADDGTRLLTSVLQARSMHHGAIHPTEKPVAGLLDPLIRYGCPPGGLVLDLFAGSGSTLDAARQCGRRAVGIEADERYAEAAARRLSNQVIMFDESA